MTRLLVSVRNAEEARLALAGGADLIDVKEPLRGALGAADPDRIAAVLQAVNGKVPVSVALGELAVAADHDVRSKALQCLAASQIRVDCREQGARYAKLGLAGCADLPDWPQRWAATLETIPTAMQRVAVAYADWHAARAPDPWLVMRHASALCCAAMLVDTLDKSRGSLLEIWPIAALTEFVDAVRSARMLVVLGGSLSLATLPGALKLQPDYIAVRGAACRGGREGPLDGQLVRALATMLKPLAPVLRGEGLG